MFTLTCLSTSSIPSCLRAFCLPWENGLGGGGGGGGGGGEGGFMLAFIGSSLIITCSGSPFSCSLVFFTGLDTGCSISLPLLKGIMACTSSIFGVDSLRKFSSCTPLGLGSVWDGNLPFSYTCCWLFRLLMEVCMVSIF